MQPEELEEEIMEKYYIEDMKRYTMVGIFIGLLLGLFIGITLSLLFIC